jgi:hypothetical protein
LRPDKLTRKAPNVNERASELTVSIVCPEGGSINFGPLRKSLGFTSVYNFLLGPIVVVDATGRAETLDDRSGIEAMALAHFRDDLGQMLEHGQGLVFFGDHDFSQIAELEIIRPNVVRVLANLASLDRFDIAVGELAMSSLNEIVEQINRVESMCGPLTGYCDGCGRPSSGYFSKPLG